MPVDQNIMVSVIVPGVNVAWILNIVYWTEVTAHELVFTYRKMYEWEVWALKCVQQMIAKQLPAKASIYNINTVENTLSKTEKMVYSHAVTLAWYL